MRCSLKINNNLYHYDSSSFIDLSIPLNFDRTQPNYFGVEKATAVPYKSGNLIGATKQGGGCNFDVLTLIPHCNGTHTECIGHITNERIDILSSLNEEMIPSTLISVTPKNTTENYTPELNAEDLVITKQELENKLKGMAPEFLKGLIIRTLPNSESKKSRDYMKEAPSFFSIDAMEYIVSLGVEHLLVDTPSVDRLLDDGHLSAHNIFWETKGKQFNLNAKNKTITEMIFTSENIKDGSYLLNLQIPAFVSDAAPSRPILYKVNDL